MPIESNEVTRLSEAFVEAMARELKQRAETLSRRFVQFDPDSPWISRQAAMEEADAIRRGVESIYRGIDRGDFRASELSDARLRSASRTAFSVLTAAYRVHGPGGFDDVEDAPECEPDTFAGRRRAYARTSVIDRIVDRQEELNYRHLFKAPSPGD